MRMKKYLIAVISAVLFSLHLSAQQCEHIVQRGEDFVSIAQKYGITTDELKASNPSSAVCYVGRKLLIPHPGEVVKRKPVKVEPFDYGLVSSLGDSVLTKSSVTAYQVGEALWRKKKYSQAMAYLSSAAYGGESRAYYPLGDCYSQPSSASHDDDAAATWYAKAVDKVKDKRSEGYWMSCLRLSENYMKGKKDVRQARRYFNEYRKYASMPLSSEATALQRSIANEETAIAKAEAAKRRAEQQVRQQEQQRRREEQLRLQKEQRQQTVQTQRQSQKPSTVASTQSVVRPSSTMTATHTQSTVSRTNGNNPIVNTWRESLGSNFVIVKKYANGGILRERYRPCPNCAGSQRCGGCYGSGRCGICGGQGGIVTSGYGRYIPCGLCHSTGQCNLCKGTGRCMCTNPNLSPYPGYVIASTSLLTPDGTEIRNTAGYNGRDDKFSITPPGGTSSSSDDNSSGSRRSSSSHSSGTCSKCHGRKYESTASTYAAASTHGWRQPYHNSGGSNCPYCPSVTDHYHYACSHCGGTGRE